MFKHHPRPWSIAYYRRCPEWDAQSCPRIVDASGATVVEMPCHVGHPGNYDEQSYQTAWLIVSAVNATASP